tara:strand:- start:1736 stop:1957 length:222 start_codon:yes stop_codon:yes gene_type:complete
MSLAQEALDRCGIDIFWQHKYESYFEMLSPDMIDYDEMYHDGVLAGVVYHFKDGSRLVTDENGETVKIKKDSL